MKHRAKNTKIFNYIRLQEVQLFVSFLGNDTMELMKAVRNFENCKIRLKPITYNSKTWTWEDFFETLKMDIIKQCLAYSLPSTVKSVTTNKFKRFSKIIEQVTIATKQPQRIMSARKIDRKKKIQKHLVELKKKIDLPVEDDSLKQMMLFGTKSTDARKSLFGVSTNSTTTQQQVVQSETTDATQEVLQTENLIDKILSEEKSESDEE